MPREAGSARSLGDLARALGAGLRGDPGRIIRGIAPLASAGPDDLSFLASPRYRAQALSTGAGAILVARGVDLPGRDLLEVDDPHLGLAMALEALYPPEAIEAGVDPGALVGAGCTIAATAAIEAGAIVGAGCRIGDRTVVQAGAVLGPRVVLGSECVIHSNVTIYGGCRLGDRVAVHSGTVIGSDGFGYAREGERHRKVPQIGNVVIEDDVEIGANVAIDRATLGSTVIARGAKIDNLVQIAHNVHVGENSLLVAQSGISGSTRLGRSVIFAGQSGAVGHIEIGDGARVGAKSAVTGDLPPGAFVIGHPAIEAGLWRRAVAVFARLPEIRHRLMRIEERGAAAGSERTGREGARRRRGES